VREESKQHARSMHILVGLVEVDDGLVRGGIDGLVMTMASGRYRPASDVSRYQRRMSMDHDVHRPRGSDRRRRSHGPRSDLQTPTSCASRYNPSINHCSIVAIGLSCINERTIEGFETKSPGAVNRNSWPSSSNTNWP